MDDEGGWGVERSRVQTQGHLGGTCGLRGRTEQGGLTDSWIIARWAVVGWLSMNRSMLKMRSLASVGSALKILADLYT